MGFNANDAGFNTQPPEGGCVRHRVILLLGLVSTHSRPKAAAGAACLSLILSVVSTHSRPKAAALANRPSIVRSLIVSTHSRPKAAA